MPSGASVGRRSVRHRRLQTKGRFETTARSPADATAGRTRSDEESRAAYRLGSSGGRPVRHAPTVQATRSVAYTGYVFDWGWCSAASACRFPVRHVSRSTEPPTPPRRSRRFRRSPLLRLQQASFLLRSAHIPLGESARRGVDQSIVRSVSTAPLS